MDVGSNEKGKIKNERTRGTAKVTQVGRKMQDSSGMDIVYGKMKIRVGEG